MNSIDSEFAKLKQVFEGAKITADREFVLVPGIRLPEGFNLPTTPLLIRLGPMSPTVYVSSELTLRSSSSPHFDRPNTEPYLLKSGWVKLGRYSPAIHFPPSLGNNLRAIVASSILFLEQMTARARLQGVWFPQ